MRLPSSGGQLIFVGNPPERTNTGGILSQQGLTLSGFREASAVDVDAGELISREGWSIEILPARSPLKRKTAEVRSAD